MNQLPPQQEIEGMKVAYIAHPIGGDVAANLRRIRWIVRLINLKNKSIVPFVPYYADCLALKDEIESERIRGIANDLALMSKGFIDYLWLYGPRISKGMRHEIAVASKYDIKVQPMSTGTEKAYAKIKAEEKLREGLAMISQLPNMGGAI